jgi:ankyrin repeat protein
MMAAFAGNKDIVRLMLDRKVEMNHAGWNPLLYASFEGHKEIVTMLVAGGADVNLKAPNGQTALMLAAKRGYLDVVRTLTAAKADLTIKSDDATALSLARSAGNTDIAKHLESLGAR